MHLYLRFSEILCLECTLCPLAYAFPCMCIPVCLQNAKLDSFPEEEYHLDMWATPWTRWRGDIWTKISYLQKNMWNLPFQHFRAKQDYLLLTWEPFPSRSLNVSFTTAVKVKLVIAGSLAGKRLFGVGLCPCLAAFLFVFKSINCREVRICFWVDKKNIEGNF